MADNEDMQEIDNFWEDAWEEITLDFLDSKIDQDFAVQNCRKSERKKHKNRRMNKATEIPNLILQFQEENCRESALRKLSTFLLEKREEDPDNYYWTAHILYNSCGTMTILLQELLTFSRMMVDGNLTRRASKRLINVLTLFQCIAADKVTRHSFVKSSVPSFLVPLILFKAPMEEFENVRAVALSVIGILCQARESDIIQWAVENNMVEVCRISIEIGNELCKVIGMHIIEAIMQDDSGLSHICNSMCNHLLEELTATWYSLVTFLTVDQDYSPRLLFHIIRCYILLCDNVGGYNVVKGSLPEPIINGSFHDIRERFPLIESLIQQLLLTVGKIDRSIPASPH
ncbi:cell differentiation protein RCD1-like [Quillaja saponaria]|uniref:Cell differentiation protein RCD1-like n=1 Tax=Quillaja saponaria TaxID=32244 RepID=A0AAD7QDY2_QUISA|nr:cell differentiation protein RCD1-like [Quillaja saponaria]